MGYSSNPIFLLPSLSMALNMSSAAFPRFVLFRALRSSARSISPLPSTSASSNTALSTKISFLLYFFSVLESSLDGMASASAPGTASLARASTFARLVRVASPRVPPARVARGRRIFCLWGGSRGGRSALTWRAARRSALGGRASGEDPESRSPLGRQLTNWRRPRLGSPRRVASPVRRGTRAECARESSTRARSRRVASGDSSLRRRARSSESTRLRIRIIASP